MCRTKVERLPRRYEQHPESHHLIIVPLFTHRLNDMPLTHMMICALYALTTIFLILFISIKLLKYPSINLIKMMKR
jgi:hypothetical protein